MSTPDPPVRFDPRWHLLPAGAGLYRVHEPAHPDGTPDNGTLFNPGFGQRTRWAFFGDPTVPVWYAAASPEAAVHESIFHNAYPGLHIGRPLWETKVLTVVTTTRDLRLVKFHSDGLRRFALHPRDLTDTDASTYPTTVKWASAAFHHGADGLAWMSRHFNTSLAVCLFGGPTGPSDLNVQQGHPHTRSFAAEADREWLAHLALTVKVTIRP